MPIVRLDPVFLSPDDELKELQCGICLQLVRRTVRCSNGHRFCGTCAYIWCTRNQPDTVTDSNIPSERLRLVIVGTAVDVPPPSQQPPPPPTPQPQPSGSGGAAGSGDDNNNHDVVGEEEAVGAADTDVEILEPLEEIDRVIARVRIVSRRLLKFSKTGYRVSKNRTRASVRRQYENEAPHNGTVGHSDPVIYRRVSRALLRVTRRNQMVRSLVEDTVMLQADSIAEYMNSVPRKIMASLDRGPKQQQQQQQQSGGDESNGDDAVAVEWTGAVRAFAAELVDTAESVFDAMDEVRHYGRQIMQSFDLVVELVNEAERLIQAAREHDDYFYPGLSAEVKEAIVVATDAVRREAETQYNAVYCMQFNMGKARRRVDELVTYVRETGVDLSEQVSAIARMGCLVTSVNGSCPMCRQLGDFLPSYDIDRVVHSLPVGCAFIDEEGLVCRWTGRFADYRHHVHRFEQPLPLPSAVDDDDAAATTTNDPPSDPAVASEGVNANNNSRKRQHEDVEGSDSAEMDNEDEDTASPADKRPRIVDENNP